MQTFIATIAHDKGIFRLKVTAKNKARAAFLIMKAEGCPSHAILQLSKAKS
jgi:hypothetical protein